MTVRSAVIRTRLRAGREVLLGELLPYTHKTLVPGQYAIKQGVVVGTREVKGRGS